MGALPAALLRPLPPAPVIAERFGMAESRWRRTVWLRSAWNLWEGRMGERRVIRKFLWISLGKAGSSSPYSYWPSLLLRSKGWSQSRSTCRPESSFILLPFWSPILLCSTLEGGERYGSIVCAWLCSLGLFTPSSQHRDTIYSKSKRFIAHLPEILPLWTLPRITIIIIIITTTILAGLQDTPLLTHGSSGSQSSALVPLHKWTVAPFSSHLATAAPWTSRTFLELLGVCSTLPLDQGIHSSNISTLHLIAHSCPLWLTICSCIHIWFFASISSGINKYISASIGKYSNLYLILSCQQGLRKEQWVWSPWWRGEDWCWCRQCVILNWNGNRQEEEEKEPLHGSWGKILVKKSPNTPPDIPFRIPWVMEREGGLEQPHRLGKWKYD